GQTAPADELPWHYLIDIGVGVAAVMLPSELWGRPRDYPAPSVLATPETWQSLRQRIDVTLPGGAPAPADFQVYELSIEECLRFYWTLRVQIQPILSTLDLLRLRPGDQPRFWLCPVPDGEW